MQRSSSQPDVRGSSEDSLKEKSVSDRAQREKELYELREKGLAKNQRQKFEDGKPKDQSIRSRLLPTFALTTWNRDPFICLHFCT